MYDSVSIILYSRLPHHEDTVNFRNDLRKQGYSFTNATRKDVSSFLHTRVGSRAKLPGILVDKRLWISASTKDWVLQLQEAVVNKMLQHTDHALEILPTHVEEEDEDGTVSDHHQQGHQQCVPLPDGTMLSVSELTHRLLEYHKRDTHTFTGKRAIAVYKRHFRAGSDKVAKDFGRLLVDHGILFVVQRNWTNFAECVVQLHATRGLNTFLPIANYASRPRPWKEAVLTLSNSMDNILHESNPASRQEMIEQFEYDTGALQASAFSLGESSDDEDSILQLYNLMVRHYSLQHELPTSLPEFLSSQEEYGYVLEGRLILASELRNWLWQRSLSARLPSIACSVKTTQPQGTSWLFRRPKRQPTPQSHFFPSPVVTAPTNAPGLLLSMVWTAAATTPCPVTLSPEATARIVCQSQVIQDGTTLWLPRAVAWFRMDFGESGMDLLNNLAPYSDVVRKILSKNQIVELQYGPPPVQLAEEEPQIHTVPLPFFGAQPNTTAKRRSKLEADVDDDDQESIGDESLYLEKEQPVALRPRTQAVESQRRSLKAASRPHSDDEEWIPPPLLGARQPSRGDIVPNPPSQRKRMTTKQCQDAVDHTDTTVTEDSTSCDYSDWYDSDTISALTFGSSRDVLVNDAYLSNGNVPSSMRSGFY